jgi:hypothetical protein
LFRIRRQFITHADVHTRVTPRANILGEVDRFERHPNPPFQRPSVPIMSIAKKDCQEKTWDHTNLYSSEDRGGSEEPT